MWQLLPPQKKKHTHAKHSYNSTQTDGSIHSAGLCGGLALAGSFEAEVRAKISARQTCAHEKKQVIRKAASARYAMKCGTSSGSSCQTPGQQADAAAKAGNLTTTHSKFKGRLRQRSMGDQAMEHASCSNEERWRRDTSKEGAAARAPSSTKRGPVPPLRQLLWQQQAIFRPLLGAFKPHPGSRSSFRSTAASPHLQSWKRPGPTARRSSRRPAHRTGRSCRAAQCSMTQLMCEDLGCCAAWWGSQMSLLYQYA
jgi:hypothetical protein